MQPNSDLLKAFYAQYPNSKKLTIVPVENPAGGYRDLFDIEDVELLLGPERFKALMAQIKEVYSCGHRVWTKHDNPDWVGAEVHCIHARDLEAFLAGSGAD